MLIFMQLIYTISATFHGTVVVNAASTWSTYRYYLHQTNCGEVQQTPQIPKFFNQYENADEENSTHHPFLFLSTLFSPFFLNFPLLLLRSVIPTYLISYGSCRNDKSHSQPFHLPTYIFLIPLLSFLSQHFSSLLWAPTPLNNISPSN